MEFPYHLYLIERIVVVCFDRVNEVLVDSRVLFIYIPVLLAETWTPDTGIDMIIMYKPRD